MSRVKIDPPNQLPSSGLTPIKYKQWKVALKIFLHQTAEFRAFYPGGKYETWLSYEDNPLRIQRLANNDNPPAGTQNAEHLAQRQIQLETFLGIIARYSDEGDFDDIMEKSTSLEWIHILHERRYGIQKKGRYFNRIDAIRFDKTTMTDYHKFYTDIRSCFKSNLRKHGETVKYKNQVLAEDEKLTPTTECLIVYMALERIDSRLPNEIDRVFGHLMDDSTTLIDIQTEIFSYIPRALASLDRDDQAELNAYHVYQQYAETPNFQQPMHQQPTYQQPNYQQPTADSIPDPTKINVNAMYSRGGSTQNRQFRPRNSRPNQRFQGQPNRRQQSQRFCKLCHALDLPQSVTQSHNSDQCRKKALLQELTVYPNQQQEYDHETENIYEDAYQMENNAEEYSQD